MGIVQTSTKQVTDNDTTTTTWNAASNFTAGNTVIVTLVHFAPGGSRITSLTVSGTTAVKDAEKTDGSTTNHAEIWRASNVAGGSTAVVMTSGAPSSNYYSGVIQERDDITASPLDQTGTGGPTSSSAPSVTSGGATTQADEVVYAVFCDPVGTNWTSSTPPSGYTELYEESDGTIHEAGSAAYIVVSSTGSQTATFATGASISWIAAMATYKLSTGAATGSGVPLNPGIGRPLGARTGRGGLITKLMIPKWIWAPAAGGAADDKVYSSVQSDDFDATDDAGGVDLAPFEFYSDQTTPNRADNDIAVGKETLPASFEWEDPALQDEAAYLWPLAHAPPIADNYEAFTRIEDASNQPEYLEDQDQLGFDISPLPLDNDVAAARAEDSSDQLEDADEDFGFSGSIPDDPVAATDPIPTEDSSDQLEDADEDFAFAVGPLADDNDVGIQASFSDQANEPEDEDFAFSLDPLPDSVESNQVFTEDSSNQPPWPEDGEDYGFTFDQAPPDFTTDQGGIEDSSNQLEDFDEDHGFATGPLAADNDIAVAVSFPDQGNEPEDEDFGFSTDPLPDGVQSDQVFVECSDNQPEDVIEEPQGFIFEPIQPDQVVEEPLPFCDFPAQSEEPPDEDFGFDDGQGIHEDVVPPPPPPPPPPSGGGGGGGGGGGYDNKSRVLEEEYELFYLIMAIAASELLD